ncbi:hypothetical protein E8E12_001493 [Didymella heteroderae]|uniref:DUF6594 domain-containing protein n=1 Tax=Didymella heteroderae TaxID=1769908 RepID=A0A9P5BXH8_9PLEO|nr:hypothetical protein E8E12_001493 [Didymella heteroderae]
MASAANSTRPQYIEDKYRDGYPRFAALVGAHSPFFFSRRFNRLRARLLLLKQDKLSQLEEKLDKIDQNETFPIFLGVSRLDANAERLSTLAAIEASLDDYDKFVQSSRNMLSLDAAETRDIESLQHWVAGNGTVARKETEYLEHSRELARLAPLRDTALFRVEIWVEDVLIRCYQGFRKDPHYDLSKDPNVYLYSGPLIKRIARVLLLSLITSLLLMPVIICNVTDTTSIRIVIVMVSTIIYLSILAELTQSKTMELVVAGATYATVLIVFVSGTDEIRPLKSS